MTPEAQKREGERLARYKAKKEAPDTWQDLTTWDRCITLGAVGSMLPFFYNNGIEIVQAPGYVVIRNEMIHEARVIPLDGRPHVGPGVRTWTGDARGHWEGIDAWWSSRRISTLEWASVPVMAASATPLRVRPSTCG